MRTLLTLAMMLVLVACAGPAETEAPSTGAPTADASAGALTVSVADFMIDPDELEVPGSTVTISVTNDGPTPHNLTVRDAAGEVVMGTEDLSVGDSETITAELEPGEYTIFCSLAGHESLGMSGTLTVTTP